MRGGIEPKTVKLNRGEELGKLNLFKRWKKVLADDL
jgi:hypothetical protein